MGDRPTGVTIIAILYTLGSVGSLFFGLGTLLFGYVFSIILLADALGTLVISYGMWEGLTWAWYLSIACYVINIIIGIVSLFLQSPSAIVSILLNMALIFYFLQEHVKKFFEV